MSARAIKRSHDRSLLKDRRRTVRRAKRASIAAGAALGATVMFAPSAEAATFEVNTLNDTAPDGCTADPDGCTLREAVADANAAAGEDVVTFASGLSGEIVLTSGEITINSGYGLSIVDDGTSEVSVSGNDASRIFRVVSGLSISGLDITDGYVDGSGGAIYVDEGYLALDGVTVTGSYATDDGGGIEVVGGSLETADSQISGNAAEGEGGGIHLDNKYGFGLTSSTLEMVGSEVSGNNASNGGGILGEKYCDIDIEASEVSGNVAGAGGPGGAGGGVVSLAGSIDIDASEITGNSALDGPAGGVSAKYADLTITDSTVSGNDAAGAAGVFIAGIGGYDEEAPGNGPDTLIRNSTISDNTAVYGAGGIGIAYIGDNAEVIVSQSTISDNSAGEGEIAGVGGGVGIYGDTYGEIEFSNSTISGNTAGFGAGVSIDESGEAYYGPGSRAAEPREVPAEGEGSLEFNNSTIADNTASEQGGGIYLGSYSEYDPEAEEAVASQSTVPLSSTIVADNTAGGAPNDLAETSGVAGGGFALNYSLVEAPGSAAVTQDPAGSSILGTDPQLGNLADNGGPTLTHLPGASSPAIDQGVDNETARDQRGERRSVDLAPDNNPPEDPTDIGSVELQTGPPPTEPETRPLTAEEIPGGCDLTLATAGLALGGTDNGQTIVGSDDPDVLRGFGGADTVVGRGGDDCLTGDDDDDTIRGKSGDDFALGGSDRDFMKGNGGDDEFRGNGGDDRVKLAGGNDSGVGGGGNDNVAAGNGEDVVKGNGGDDRLFGNDGDDEIKGGGGKDVIFGGGGVNDIDCGSGDDKVIVNGNKDQIAADCETIKVRGADKN